MVTFDKSKGFSNLKSLFDNYLLSIWCVSEDSHNLMKWIQIHGVRSLTNKHKLQKNCDLDNTTHELVSQNR
jgi:hypothetical protein